MRPVLAMTAACLASWALVAALPGGPGGRDVGLGMVGPLLGAVGTWILIARTVRVDPGRLTNRLVAALLVKVVFFGAYVALALRGLSAHLVPFAVSFASYFIALHLVEAILLRRALTQPVPGTVARDVVGC
jgi:hypothetical protein